MVSTNSSTHLVKNSLNICDRGWIKATDIRSDKFFYVCENTQLKKNAKESLFDITSGKHIGKTVTLSKNYFGLEAYCKSQIFSQKANLLIENDKLFFEEKILNLLPTNNLPKGKYKIAYPDRQRTNLPERYFSSKGTMFASTWFPIIDSSGLEKSHLHIGTYSKGCLTVNFNSQSDLLSSWNDLYHYLINSNYNQNYLGELKLN